jgi:hypothetical protein
MHGPDPFTPPPDPPSAEIRRTVTGAISNIDLAMAINGQLVQLAVIVGSFTTKRWFTFLIDAHGQPFGAKPAMPVPNAAPGSADFCLVECDGGWRVEGWMELYPPNQPPEELPLMLAFSERETEIWTRIAAGLIDLNS